MQIPKNTDARETLLMIADDVIVTSIKVDEKLWIVSLDSVI